MTDKQRIKKLEKELAKLKNVKPFINSITDLHGKKLDPRDMTDSQLFYFLGAWLTGGAMKHIVALCGGFSVYFEQEKIDPTFEGVVDLLNVAVRQEKEKETA